MPLDFAKLVTQVSGMIGRLKDAADERLRRFRHAMDTLNENSEDIGRLKARIAAGRTTWLVADPVERLDSRYPAPPVPPSFTVMAADGSQIDVDRHRSTRCYLLNIGSAVISYGASPDAVLESHPRLYSEEHDLVIRQQEERVREQPVEGGLLGIKRSVEECRHLASLAADMPRGGAGLALIDGSLILWGLEAYPEFVAAELLDNGLIRHLEEMRKLGQDRNLALASYISFPRSTDVVNALRVAVCPHEPVDCDRCLSRDCDAVAGVRDRDLFQEILDTGERSALFASRSSVVEKHYGAHRVYFFYLKTSEEIARVEVPRWVAEDNGRLDLAHALIFDQCQRGQGYPVALSEAHEKAVVTAADREQFWELVESTLIQENVPAPDSAKSRSKRTRWL